MGDGYEGSIFHRLCRFSAALGALLALILLAPSASFADACTPPIASPVACENTKPGTPQSQWEVIGAGDQSIQGYGTSMSVNKGQTISFKIKSATPNFRIDILRLGYYQGLGARMIAAGLRPTGPTTQPPCLEFDDTGLIDCGNWSVTRSWMVPANAVSGVYIARLTRDDNGNASQIVFVVRDDSSHSDIVFQTPDATWQAYNPYGGNDLYQCSTSCPPGNPTTYKAAYKVSYNRPFLTGAYDGGRSWLFGGGEYPMIRWIEQNGYDVSYIAGADVASRSALLLNHKMFLTSGHDEYLSGTQRTALEQARDAGLHLAFFSGNSAYWKTRFEPSADGTNTADRTLVSYKDTHFTEQVDPVEWTGTWRDPRYTSPADNTPENALLGTSFIANSGTSRIEVGAAFGKLRMWRNTAAASLSSGQVLTLAPDTLGYEWDQDADNGYRPAGLFRLSSTTRSNVEVFTDYGSTTQFGQTATHHMTMYRAPSGARVFSSATVQWAWGLSNWNPNESAPDVNMQQATVNLFADMGSQPATLQSNLTPATASTDNTPPTSTINSLPSSVNDGANVTISGTATDAGGGQVAGIEVSTDGGQRWHPANGTTNWTYTWNAHGHPSATIRVRAVDDSGNLQTPGAGTSVTVNCPCSIWGPNYVPDRIVSDEALPVEVGVKFRSEKFGTITGIRFYKVAGNTGTHIGNLWTESGQRLAQATFSGESASGWQTVTFATPVQILPDTTYVASYFAPNGRYAATSAYFYDAPAPGPNGGAADDSPPVSAVKNIGTTTNGVFSYGSSSTFPSNSWNAANYWVDVVFSPLPVPGAVTGASATSAGLTSARVTWTAPSSGGPVTSYRITPYIGSTPQTPTTVSNSPATTSATITGLTNGTTYTFRVEAVNPNGAGPMSAPSNPVTPLTAVVPGSPSTVNAKPATNSAALTWTPATSDGDSPITGQTITPYIGSVAQTPVNVGPTATSATVTGLTNGANYTFRVSATNAIGTGPESSASNAVTPQTTIFDFATPTIIDAGDPYPVELGFRFKADHNGWITGIRFYKSAANTGTHIGNLWTSTGMNLASATFTNETASGWQTVTFASPVPVTASTTYVASYFTPTGHPSATSFGFQSPISNGPLHTVANAISPNGVYAAGPSSAFPSHTYNATNYWVDVMYAMPQPGQVTGLSAIEAGLTSADLTWSAPASGGPVMNYRITPYIGSTPQTPTTVGGGATQATIAGLTNGATYRFRVEAMNANGAGPASAFSNEVTPLTAVVPSAPSNVIARPASGSVQLSWTRAEGDGDSPISKQTITPYVGPAAQTPVEVSPTATSATIDGLGNGKTYTFKVSATNGVGTGPESAASSAVTPNLTLFDFATPAIVDAGDPYPVELGMKFRADHNGWITGIRFYKAAANTGTHIGNLWSTGGTRLATATFTNESASGWQTVMFAEPVAVTAGTTYIASYFTPTGHPSVTSGHFNSSIDNGPLHALNSNVSPNGVFAESSVSAFPNQTYQATNYWVDVMYAVPQPGQVTGVTAGEAGTTSASVTWTAPSSGGPVTGYRITPYVGSQAQTATTVPATATSAIVNNLTTGTTYRFRVEAVGPSGAGIESAPSNELTPTGPVAPSAPSDVLARPATNSARVSWTPSASDGDSPITGQTVTPYVGNAAQTPVQVSASATSVTMTGLTNGATYTFRVSAINAIGTGAESAPSNQVTPYTTIFDFDVPAVVDAGDPFPVELGMKFQSDTNGWIAGIRFYKSAANTGTHIGNLWSTNGTRLATATFTNESASGWQTVMFAEPVAVTAGTTYIASYFTPTGHPSVTGLGFALGVDHGPLHALANAESPNGVFTAGPVSAFPTSSYNATNYWVDVLFAEQEPAP